MAYKQIIKRLQSNSPSIMGVLNVTPDSFSDGGKFIDPAAAVKQAVEMEKSGAMIIDIGAESSRPGAKPVDQLEELRRVIPVIQGLQKIRIRKKSVRTKSKVLISIDTYKPAVAAVALELGADIVNDISGLRDPLMREVVAQAQCPVVLMHMQGMPGNMQKRPQYNNVVNDVSTYFRKQIALAKKSGIRSGQIILDPGIGFGKTVQHSLELLNNIDTFKKKFPRNVLLIGASRKSFIGKLTGAAVEDRLPGTLAAHIHAVQQGTNIVRAHDVEEHVQALSLLSRI